MAATASLPGSCRDMLAQTTLDQLKAQFFLALEDEVGEALSQFYSAFCAFQDTLQSIDTLLSPQMHAAITEFTSMVSAVSDSLLESESPDIVDRFKTNLLKDLLPPAEQKPHQPASTRYIEQSIRWLRRNIHNPYPSRATRNSIARDTESSVKDIDAWFIDARKRIGWSDMRCSRFNNRKADIVDAATRFFTNSDPLRPLDSIIESEFAAILSTVEQIYQEKYSGSTLAAHLDEVVRDLTPDLQASLSKQRRQGQLETRHSKTRRRLHPYPTPELSPALSSTPLATLESPSLELCNATPDKSRKRSRSSSEDYPSDNESERSAKRTRRSADLVIQADHSSCYPSPASSFIINDPELPAEPICTEVSSTSSGKRKRTLSGSGIARSAPTREPALQPSTFSNLPPLSVNDILDRTVFCSSPITSSSNDEAMRASEIAQQGSYSYFNAFAAFFTAFTGPGTDAINAISSQPLNQLPLLNIADEVPPASVHVEYDQSWSLDFDAGELAPSIDTSITGCSINFDDFGSSLYSDSNDLLSGPTQQWGSFWLAAPSHEPYASGSSSGSNATSSPPAVQLNPSTPSHTLHSSPPAQQLYLSTPSPTGAYHCLDIPAKGARQLFPLSDPPSPRRNAQLPGFTDKAKELMELEARCAALRDELATAC